MPMESPSLFKSYISISSKQYKGGKAKPQNNNGKTIYKLSSNENLLGSSPLALQAIRDNIHRLNEYPEQKGESLQLALADYYKEELMPAQFITANSGVGIIELIIGAFLEEGLECIVSNPAFSPYSRFAVKVGAKVVDVPLVGDTLTLDLEGILNAINEKTRIVWVCSPNNPSGTYIPKKQIDALIEHLPKHVVLVYDEVYRHFANAEDYTIGLPYVLNDNNVIAINSFSKAYGLAGIRVGYAYSTPEIASYVNHFRRPFFINTLSLEASKAALKDVAFIAKTKRNINEGKAYLYRELDRLGVKYWYSQTNFIMIKPNMDAKEFEAKIFSEGVMVRPVAGFGAPDCVRVTVGTPEANEAFINGLQIVLGL